MSKNHRRDRLPDIEVAAGASGESAPFEAGEVNEDGSPAGLAFSAGDDGDPGDEAAAVEAEKDVPAEPGTIEPPTSIDATPETYDQAMQARRLNSAAERHAGATPNGEEPKKALTRREQIVARIAEIERDGGPIGRTQRVNEEANEFAKEMHETARSMAKRLSEMRAKTRRYEQVQQVELEEARVLKIELGKLSD